MSANGDELVLADVTNKVSNVQVNEEARERVKEANWGAQHEYDYAKYTAGPRDKAAPASEQGQQQGDAPDWAANAAKYEWDEEYGDIGPEHEELKQMLFGDEHKMAKGVDFNK